MFADSTFGGSHQVEHLPSRFPHLAQDGFGRNAAIHHPHPPRFSVGLFDVFQKRPQRLMFRRVAIHHFVCQRKSVRRDHQRDHHLQTVRSVVAAVAAFGFRILLHLSFEVRAGQVVQQHLEVSPEQLRPFLL